MAFNRGDSTELASGCCAVLGAHMEHASPAAPSPEICGGRVRGRLVHWKCPCCARETSSPRGSLPSAHSTRTITCIDDLLPPHPPAGCAHDEAPRGTSEMEECDQIGPGRPWALSTRRTDLPSSGWRTGGHRSAFGNEPAIWEPRVCDGHCRTRCDFRQQRKSLTVTQFTCTPYDREAGPPAELQCSKPLSECPAAQYITWNFLYLEKLCE